MKEGVVGIPTEQEINRNKPLALKIKNILDNTANFLPTNSKMAIYDGPFTIVGGDGILLSSIPTKGPIYDDAHVPTGFQLPAYAFKELYRGNLNRGVDTPYGHLPSYAKTADGEIYSFVNYFIVNEEGQGIRYEIVNKTKAKYFTDAEAQQIKLLAFAPNEKASRHVPLDEKDYTVVDGILGFIEANGYRTVRE